MKYSEAQLGRVFILKLEDGEVLHEVIERFAIDKGIRCASLIVVGGAGDGSRIVVGPQNQYAEKIDPVEYIIDNAHEVSGVGTIFPNEKGKPVLHLHASFGRGNSSKTGCVRLGVKVWLVLEVVLIEILNCKAMKLLDTETGFEILEP